MVVAARVAAKRAMAATRSAMWGWAAQRASWVTVRPWVEARSRRRMSGSK